MAEKQIKSEDIIQNDVFKNATESADALLEKINLLIVGIKDLAQITGKKIPLTDPKSLSEAEQLQEALKKIAELEKGLTDVQKIQIQAQTIANTKRAEYRKHVQDTITLANNEATSLNALRVQLSQLQRQWDALSASQRNNESIGGKLKKQIQDVDKQVKSLEETTGRHGRSVGDYGKALKSVEHLTRALGIETGQLTAIQKVFNIVLKANPIFWIIGIITAVIAGFVALRDKVKFVSDAIDWLGGILSKVVELFYNLTDAIGLTNQAFDNINEKAIKKHTENMESLTEKYEFQIRAARALGKETKQLEIEMLKAQQREQAQIAARLIISQRTRKLSEDEQKQLEESKQAVFDYAKDITILELEIQKDISDKSEEAREKELKELREFQKERLDINVEANDENVKKYKDYLDKISEANFKAFGDQMKEKKDEEDEIERFNNESDRITSEMLKKQAEDKKKARQKEIEENLATEKIYQDAIFSGVSDRIKKEKQANSDYISELDKQIQFQQQLAVSGEANTLAELQKERAKALEEKRKLEEKEAKRKEAQDLAEIFMEFMKVNAKERFGASAKALAQTLAAKGLSKLIAGAFAEGVEDFKGKGTETSDSNLIAFSRGESVLTAKGTKETSGLATAINESGFDGARRWAMDNIFPTIPMLSDVSRSEQINKAMVSMLRDEMKGLKDAIKSMDNVDFEENVVGEIVKIKRRQGVIEKTTYKNVSSSYSKH